MRRGWLANDCVETIPGVRNLLSDLLCWIPGLEDKTGGFTPFDQLANRLEAEAALKGAPDYIIRNASYFRPIEIARPTIALIQDIAPTPEFRLAQLDVMKRATLVVANSFYTLERYPEARDRRHAVIPIGVDQGLFCPAEGGEGEGILFVGWNSPIKGADRLYDLIEALPWQFIAISRDRLPSHPRLRQVVQANAQTVAAIMRAARLGVVLSRTDTQNVAAVEMGLSGIPIIGTNVGILYERADGPWGRLVRDPSQIRAAVEEELGNDLTPARRWAIRSYWLDQGVRKSDCRRGWLDAVESVVGGRL